MAPVNVPIVRYARAPHNPRGSQAAADLQAVGDGERDAPVTVGRVANVVQVRAQVRQVDVGGDDQRAGGFDTAAETDPLVGPLYYRALVTVEPIDDAFVESVVAAFLRRAG